MHMSAGVHSPENEHSPCSRRPTSNHMQSLRNMKYQMACSYAVTSTNFSTKGILRLTRQTGRFSSVRAFAKSLRTARSITGFMDYQSVNRPSQHTGLTSKIWNTTPTRDFDKVSI